jgi:flagellar protein FliO/FliZ
MIRIVSSLALNSKDRLLLVQIGEEQILISASPGRIGKVHELQAPVDPASFDSLQKTRGRSFNSLFTQVLQGSRQ